MGETENNLDENGRVPGRYAYEGLERVIHEKARLSILSSLASHQTGLLFNDLKALCSLTDGNLSRQLQVLQEAGFVEGKFGRRHLCRFPSEASFFQRAPEQRSRVHAIVNYENGHAPAPSIMGTLTPPCIALVERKPRYIQRIVRGLHNGSKW